MENLAGWVLERSYPTLPIETEDLSNPVCEDDIPGLFSAIFKRANSDPDLLANFGPALGLSQDHSSGIYDPSDCTTFPIIKEFIGKGPVGFRYLHQHLAFELGLTAQLASLFTVLFINHEVPEIQLQLSHDSELFMGNDSQLLGTRLTSDLIPLLGWNKDLADNVVAIGPASPPSFSDARHHLFVLCLELTACNDFKSENESPHSMDSVREMVVTSSRVMNILQQSEVGSGDTDDTGHLSWALERLRKITNSDYAKVYAAIRTTYASLPGLADDLIVVRNLAMVEVHAPDIVQVRQYVSKAEVPEAEYPNLAVDQETLLTPLSIPQLTKFRSRGWSAISRNATAFKMSYAKAY